MKSTLALLLTLSCLALAATNEHANAKPKPAAKKLNPRLDALLAAAYDMVDVEGECARKACAALNDESTCTKELVDTYRPQCEQVLINTGLKKEGEAKVLDQKMRKKLEGAVGRARGVVGRVREGMDRGEL